MKTNTLFKLLLVGLLTFATSVNANFSANYNNEEPPAKSQNVSLKKGELFIVISAEQKQNVGPLLQSYFQKVFPPASKHGFKQLAQLPIDKAFVSDYKPNNYIGLYSWPNPNSVQDFLKEMPQDELLKLRKPIWKELKQNVMAVTKDYTFQLKEGKTYEVKTVSSGGTFDDTAYTKLILEKNGKILVNSELVAYEDLNNGTKPSRLYIIEWPDQKVEMKACKKTCKSYPKTETFYTHFELPKQ